MPATRPEQNLPAHVDLPDANPTEAIKSVATTGAAVADLTAMLNTLQTYALDATEGALTERHLIRDTLHLMGRRFSDRMWLRRALQYRDYPTERHYTAHRTRLPLDEQDIPPYLTDPRLTEIANRIHELRKLVDTLAQARTKQYPEYHNRLLATLAERTQQEAS